MPFPSSPKGPRLSETLSILVLADFIIRITFDGPIPQSTVVPTGMRSLEEGHRPNPVLRPNPGHQGHVSRTHNALAEAVDAVFFNSGSSGQRLFFFFRELWAIREPTNVRFQCVMDNIRIVVQMSRFPYQVLHSLILVYRTDTKNKNSPSSGDRA